MNGREVILAILLLVTLAGGIAMALCISLIMRPMDVKTSTKYVSASGLNLMEMNKRCNCGIMGLDYKFVSKRAPGGTKSSVKNDSGRTKMISDISKQQLRTSVGTEAFYDELDYLRSIGVDNDEIVSRLLSMNASDLDTNSYISAIASSTTGDSVSTTDKRDIGIDDKLLNSIWRMIATKKLNTTTDDEGEIEKRSYPSEAPHCFVPLPKKNILTFENQTLWKYHSNLISISGPQYLDDTDDLRYLCSGIIIHREYAITGKHCIRDKFIKLLRIRSDSRYWCKEGLQHRISDVYFSPTLALIKIHPHFKIGEGKLRNLKVGMGGIPSSFDVAGTSAGWTRDDTRRLSKYAITTWGVNCHDCRKIATDNGSCPDPFGHPLIDTAGILIGIRSCGDAFVKINEIQPLLIKFQAIVS